MNRENIDKAILKLCKSEPAKANYKLRLYDYDELIKLMEWFQSEYRKEIEEMIKEIDDDDCYVMVEDFGGGKFKDSFKEADLKAQKQILEQLKEKLQIE